MRGLFQRLRYYYFFGLFGTLFLRMYPHARKLLKQGKYREAHAWRSLWSARLLKAGGIRMEVISQADVDFSRTYIICANHSSYMDIPVMCAALPIYFGFLGKAEAGDAPLIRDFFQTIDIAVARESAAGSAVSFKKSIQAIREGRSLMIFPEGGIFPDPLQLKPLKGGAFELAARLKVPILPVGLPDNYKLVPDEVKLAKTGRIRIILHEPISPEGLTAEELKEKLHRILQEDIIKYADED